MEHNHIKLNCILFLLIALTSTTLKSEVIGDFSYSFDQLKREAYVSGPRAYSVSIVNPVIPESVTYFGDTYPVVEIKSGAFSGDYVDTNLSGHLTIAKTIKKIGDSAFDNNVRLTGSLIIPESVTRIGCYAFRGCTGFDKTLSLGSSVAIIEENAFYNCTGFTGELHIPDATITIGDNAFRKCTGFASLSLGAGVEEIYCGAFFETKFKSITIHAKTPPEIKYYTTVSVYAFDPSLYEVPLYVPAESIEAYKTAYEWQNFFDIRPITTEAEGIKLNTTEASLMVGQELSLTATILPENSTDKTISWESSDETIAKVDQQGKVTAVSVGKAMISATTSNGLTATCSVSVWIKGDVNGDGVINVADIVQINNYIAGSIPKSFSVEAADLDGDGQITSADTMLIAQMIMNSNANPTIIKPLSRARQGSLTATVNNNIISLSLPDAGFTAFQADIKLTDDVQLTEISLTENFADSHTLLSSDQGNNTTRILVFSMTNATLTADQPIVTISLTTFPTGTIEGSNILASDASGQSTPLFLEVDKEANAIESVDADNRFNIEIIKNGVIVHGEPGSIIKCFTTDGLLIKQLPLGSDPTTITLPKGLNILSISEKSYKVLIQ